MSILESDVIKINILKVLNEVDTLSMNGLRRPTQNEGLAGENATNEPRLEGEEAFDKGMPTLGLGFTEDAYATAILCVVKAHHNRTSMMC